MYDFVRVAAAVPRVAVADTDFNSGEVIRLLKKADEKNADIVVFPELCVTGYTCADLFLWDTLVKNAAEAVARIAERVKSTAVVGAPIILEGQLYNCAVVISAGKICGIVPKTFIPDYNEFYEKRWFSSSEECRTKLLSSEYFSIGEHYDIPVGRGLIFSVGNEMTFGAEICEDAWTPITPGTFLSLGGAELILNLSASNETAAKRDYRRQMLAQHSASLVCTYVYASSGADESTTDLVFSGHSLIAENGSVIAENDKLADSDYLLMCDTDIGKIKADRKKIKTFKDSAAVYGKFEPCVRVELPVKKLRADGSLCRVTKHPFIPSDKADRIKRCKDIFTMQAAALKKRLSITGCKPVIGVSGGLDSTLALLVAAKAAGELDGREVIGITMPCFGTTSKTYNNSLRLMESLGITAKEINIREACLKHFEDIGQDENTFDVTYENCQARERTQVLMDYACKCGGLVVGTGDLSELALGWCTYNADHMSMYGVNAGVPKTLVKWMIDAIIDFDVFPKSTEVLRSILDTPISPELLPPDETGKIAQKTEDIVGPYELHDFFLYNALRFGFEPKKVFYLARLAFADSYAPEVILMWLKNFYRRFFTQQFKRSCLPDGVKIGSLCLSPRGDLRMPSDASSAIWLKQLEEIDIRA